MLLQEHLWDNQTANAIEVLEDQFEEQTALDQLLYIHQVRHVFQFSLNPAHELIRWDQKQTRHSQDDAFTFTMKALMRHLCLQQKHLLPLTCLPSISDSHPSNPALRLLHKKQH